MGQNSPWSDTEGQRQVAGQRKIAVSRSDRWPMTLTPKHPTTKQGGSGHQAFYYHSTLQAGPTLLDDPRSKTGRPCRDNRAVLGEHVAPPSVQGASLVVHGGPSSLETPGSDSPLQTPAGKQEGQEEEEV